MNYSKYMDVQQEVKLIEKELVDLIIQHLKSNRIAVDIARQQAKDFLALLPIEDQRDLLNKLKGLGEKYEEAKEVYAVELGKVNEVARQQTLNQMRMHIQAGNIDAAISAAKAMYPEKQSADGSEHPEQALPAQPAQPVSAPTVLTTPEQSPAQPVQTPVPQQAVNQPAQSVQQPVNEKGDQQ